MVTEEDLQFNDSVWEWTGRTLSLLERVLRVRIRLHLSPGQLEAGEIFLFNHFARFETFIPQWLFYREAGVLSRSIASAEFFGGDNPLGRYLLSLGAVPTDYPDLLPFLAAEIFRGRKVLLFPEGGMVKDRRVVDEKGRYSIYSRSALERRKHHTGAAVLGLAVEGFKTAVREARAAGQGDRLDTWAEALGLDSAETLLRVARRPTQIYPATITFYPIRATENLLHRGAELFHSGLSPRLAEELMVEGNILLKDTDMDIRLGSPILPAEFWSWPERRLLRRVARRAKSLREFFHLGEGRWDGRLLARRMRRRVLRLRDAYMVGMYRGVTVNLSHLASRIILDLLESGVDEVEKSRFHRALYLALKKVQGSAQVHLHPSVRDPDEYAGLLEGRSAGLEQLIEAAAEKRLLVQNGGRYRFLARLREERDFDEVRVENFLAVYANEVAPLAAIKRAVRRALRDASAVDDRRLARYRFDDEVRSYAWDLKAYRRPEYEEINKEQTATLSGEPFLFIPRNPRGLGVVLVHGFTASPAEVRPFGERLRDLGYPVIGVRLKGHGTSPWDLMARSQTDWLVSVGRGREILGAFCERVCLVGFSAGGALSLLSTAERPSGVAGVVAIAAPLVVRDRNMRFVPMMDEANRLVDRLSPLDGVMLFHRADPEHPEINYNHMPIRGLRELGRLMDRLRDRAGEVASPVLLIQGTEDPTVDPRSSAILLEELGTVEKELVEVSSSRHGILYEDVGGTQEAILGFLARLEERAG